MPVLQRRIPTTPSVTLGAESANVAASPAGSAPASAQAGWSGVGDTEWWPRSSTTARSSGMLAGS